MTTERGIGKALRDAERIGAEQLSQALNREAVNKPQTVECSEHGSPASLYDDGSIQCLHCCTVETFCRCTAATRERTQP